MSNTMLAIILKPFMLFGFLCFLLAVRKSIQKFMPEGKLKNILLREV